MDRAKAKLLVSILRSSSLYNTMSHEEKISLLSRLENDYPGVFSAEEDGKEEEETRQC